MPSREYASLGSVQNCPPINHFNLHEFNSSQATPSTYGEILLNFIIPYILILCKKHLKCRCVPCIVVLDVILMYSLLLFLVLISLHKQ